MRWPDEPAFEADLRAALALDDTEHDFLGALNLAGHWRPAQEASVVARLAWLPAAVFATLVAAWLFVTPLAGPVAGGALGFAAAVLLRMTLGLAWTLGESLLTIAANPLLNFSIPALALLGLALLAWPRSLKGQFR